LHNAQHGFLPGRSVTTNWISALHDWTLAYDRSGHTNVVYADFAKAFDVFSHPKLLFKLPALGIGGLVLDSIRAFLSNRKQQIRLGKPDF